MMDIQKASRIIAAIAVGIVLGLIFFVVQIFVKFLSEQILRGLGNSMLSTIITFCLHLCNAFFVFLFLFLSGRAIYQKRRAFIAHILAISLNIFTLIYIWIYH